MPCKVDISELTELKQQYHTMILLVQQIAKTSSCCEVTSPRPIAHERYQCAAAFLRPRYWRLHRLQRYSADKHHHHCRIVFHSTSADRLQGVRWCLPQHALLSLLYALVVSKIDYCCSVFGLCFIPPTLSREHAAVSPQCSPRLIFLERRSDHITPLLRDLH